METVKEDKQKKRIKNLLDKVGKLEMQRKDLLIEGENLRKQIRENKKEVTGAFNELQKSINAILLRVIEQYGVDGVIEIMQPDVNDDHLVVTERKDGKYILKVTENEK